MTVMRKFFRGGSLHICSHLFCDRVPAASNGSPIRFSASRVSQLVVWLIVFQLDHFARGVKIATA